MPDVTILVADDHLDAVDAVAAALQDAGLRLDQVLPATGVITGAVDDAAALEELSAVPGVAAVQEAETFQIPPPDAPLQ